MCDEGAGFGVVKVFVVLDVDVVIPFVRGDALPDATVDLMISPCTAVHRSIRSMRDWYCLRLNRCGLRSPYHEQDCVDGGDKTLHVVVWSDVSLPIFKSALIELEL